MTKKKREPYGLLQWVLMAVLFLITLTMLEIGRASCRERV